MAPMGDGLKGFSEIQPFILGVLLIWAGIWKIQSPDARKVVRESALAGLVSPQIAQVGHFLLGLIEGVTGASLLLPPTHWMEKWFVALIGCGFLVYLGLAKRRAPDRPCACMGSQKVPISWRSFGRAGLFFAMAMLSWKAEDSWALILMKRPWFIGLVIAEFLLFCWFSPDVGWERVIAAVFRRSSFLQQDCATTPEHLSKSLKRLQRSRAFREFQPFLRGESIDQWREGCWRFFCFPASWEGQPVIAVFALPITGSMDQIRAVLVDEERNQVLRRWGIEHTS